MIVSMAAAKGANMKYMGSKARIAKHILPIILASRKEGQYYVEPMCGGMNSIDKVDGNRIANDANYYLMEMWKRLIDGSWLPPKYIERERYNDIRSNPGGYAPEEVGWVGFNCSYSGMWFGGFAGKTKTKINTIRNYQQEAINNVFKQVKKLQGVVLSCVPYYDLILPENSIVYCDPPYENTTGYKGEFDHWTFWHWCRNKTELGHTVFISEYNAPDDFECVWGKEVKSSLSANGKVGGNKNSVEKLFKYRGKRP